MNPKSDTRYMLVLFRLASSCHFCGLVHFARVHLLQPQHDLVVVTWLPLNALISLCNGQQIIHGSRTAVGGGVVESTSSVRRVPHDLPWLMPGDSIKR
jgi:hypothetical protein